MSELTNINNQILVCYPNEPLIDDAPLPAEPTLRAKLVAERCIKHLNTQREPLEIHLIENELVTNNELEKIKEQLTPIISEGSYEEEALLALGFILIGKGSSNCVWAHSNYPEIVFKFMEPEDAEAQVQGAKISREACLGKYWFKAPRALSIVINGLGVYIEERLPLSLGTNEHEEVWSRISYHFQSSDSSAIFKNNLISVFRNMLLFVKETRSWDTGYHNFPEISIDGKYFCAVDFDGLIEDDDEDDDDDEISDGIQNIVNLLPFRPFLDISKQEIFPEISGKRKNYEEEAIEDFENKMQETHRLHQAFQQRLIVYDTNHIITGSENNIKPLTEEALSQLDEYEKAFVQQLLNEINTSLINNANITNTVSFKHTVRFTTELFYTHLIANLEPEKPQSPIMQEYKHLLLLRSMQFLKKQGVILDYDYPDNFAFTVLRDEDEHTIKPLNSNTFSQLNEEVKACVQEIFNEIPASQEYSNNKFSTDDFEFKSNNAPREQQHEILLCSLQFLKEQGIIADYDCPAHISYAIYY
ncbi:MAG: hypothetical protein V4494_04795 [Chlamydiota bacterium]